MSTWKNSICIVIVGLVVGSAPQAALAQIPVNMERKSKPATVELEQKQSIEELDHRLSNIQVDQSFGGAKRKSQTLPVEEPVENSPAPEKAQPPKVEPVLVETQAPSVSDVVNNFLPELVPDLETTKQTFAQTFAQKSAPEPKPERVAEASIENPAAPPEISVAQNIPLSTFRRPTSQILDQCTAEVVESKNGYSLVLQVPEIVTSVEVVGSGNRALKIDRGTKLVTEPTSVAATENRVASKLENTQRIQQADDTKSDLPLATTYQGGTPAKLNSAGGTNRFKPNPFYGNVNNKPTGFVAKASESSYEQANQLDFGTTSHLPAKHSLTQKILELRTDLQDSVHHQAPPAAMEQPSVDIRRLVKQAPGTLKDEASANALIPIEILSSGPPTMHGSGTADFVVKLRNRSQQPVSDFDVRLSLPEGMKVTVLDRIANYDKKYHTVTWSFDKLEANETVKLQYRVQSLLDGRHTQAYEVGREGRYGNLTTLSTSTYR